MCKTFLEKLIVTHLVKKKTNDDRIIAARKSLDKAGNSQTNDD
jgi:hypothetical protein